MIPVLVFDIETVPDVVGLRALNDFPSNMSDHDGEVALVRSSLSTLDAPH